jgi:ubiquinone/menaquinone biosynthesis C-methylase UbiE
LYRWDYAPQAIERIFEITGIRPNSTVADIGAGTGILTRQFAGRCGQVYAIEPNGPMRAYLERNLGAQPGWLSTSGRAEDTGLMDHSVDLIAVGQALSWFDPQPTRLEFRRIIKPGGWLAAIRNVGTYGEMDAALEKVYPKETDTSALMKGKDTPISFYYDEENYIEESFYFCKTETWEDFIGALGTASYAPDESSVLWERFEHAARQVFDQYKSSGRIQLMVETKLLVGRIRDCR